MPDDPEEFTQQAMWRLLLEIRAKLGEHDQRFDEQDKRFAELRAAMDHREGVVYQLGKHVAALVDGQTDTNKLVGRMEQRLAQVEEKIGPALSQIQQELRAINRRLDQAHIPA